MIVSKEQKSMLESAIHPIWSTKNFKQIQWSFFHSELFLSVDYQSKSTSNTDNQLNYLAKLILGSDKAYIYYMLIDIINSFLCYSSHCVSLPTAGLPICKYSCCKNKG